MFRKLVIGLPGLVVKLLNRLRRAVSWEELGCTLWIPCYLLCFKLLEDVPARGYLATQMAVDRLIPYNSLFVIPYVSWYPLLIGVGVWLALHRKESFQRYMLFLSATSFLSVLLWMLVPNGQDLRPEVPGGVFGAAVAYLYRIDTNTNVFPSLHVVGSIGAAVALFDGLFHEGGRKIRLFRNSASIYGGSVRRSVLSAGERRRNRNICLAVSAQALLICLSTLFIKQHSVLDVAGGVLFSTLVGIPIYRGPAPYRNRVPAWFRQRGRFRKRLRARLLS